MMASDREGEAPIERSRKPYVPPKVIFSELYVKGVGKNLSPTPDFHSGTTSTS
jgi:hypothetical protein